MSISHPDPVMSEAEGKERTRDADASVYEEDNSSDAEAVCCDNKMFGFGRWAENTIEYTVDRFLHKYHPASRSDKHFL